MTTRIVNDRKTALKIGFDATDWNYPITFEEHVERAKNWDVNVIERDGQPIGAMFEKDGEVHCSILPARFHANRANRTWRGTPRSKGQTA